MVVVLLIGHKFGYPLLYPMYTSLSDVTVESLSHFIAHQYHEQPLAIMSIYHSNEMRMI